MHIQAARAWPDLSRERVEEMRHALTDVITGHRTASSWNLDDAELTVLIKTLVAIADGEKELFLRSDSSYEVRPAPKPVKRPGKKPAKGRAA